MGNLEQRGEQSWDATQTLWRDAIAEGSVAEDSIRVVSHCVATLANSKPRFRTLEPAPESSPDFLLGQELGSGGMGIVYAANQTAFNREVAVKMVKPGRKSTAGAADALMAEAVVTGHLEHPNVVPIYDLGIDAEGNLFYAMKEVQGFPWSKVMGEKTLDENLGVLQRVADTISFAHSRGVLHRDLKPHNIMLGEFGEVMVMDWGASCMVEGPVDNQSAETSFCGTPAYMPPEMARGDMSRQGETSDVYLLGAMLYQIISGHPPRREKDPVLCLNLASENFIEPLEEHGELLRIAFKAMASAPADRFSNVRKFQQAIRDYRSHSESLALQESAQLNLARAKKQRDYDLFNRAIFGFREALDLWPGNPDAERLRIEASVEYARCAFGNNDFELAQSLVDPADPLQRELLDLIGKAIRDRDAHKRQNRQLLFIARMLGFFLLLLFAAAFFMVRAEQRKTHAEHRQSLTHLIAAHYGEKNYEAAVSSFWKLHDQYGMDSLEEETLLDVRVAAAMNPYRGSVATGLSNPLGIVPANEERCVWVVGERELKKVRLNPAVGYDSATLVSIHDFTFGKRKAPGAVVEAIVLPASVIGAESVHEGIDGTFWAGSSSILYRRDGESWMPVLDVSQLEYPPLPEEYNIDRAAVEEWMVSAGRKLPISGILLDQAQRHVAVALGTQTVCWIDLETKQCLGWLAAGHGTRFGQLLKGGENTSVKLLLSPDETRLVYHPSVMNSSLLFAMELPSMRRESYVYNRDYPIQSIAFSSGERNVMGITQDGFLFSPDEQFILSFSKFYMGEDRKNLIRWGRERCDVARLPHSDIRHAAFSPDDGHCCSLTEDGHLYVGRADSIRGFELVRSVVDR
ncbi:serine/threonine-protein kinase [Pontiellaceae bacterium B1224]|nr:serine/threonine-protein kinase [Pontiellaceae bacterium B1224]